MRLVLSTGEVLFCLCATVLALYISPFFVQETNANASNAWEFLLLWDDKDNYVDNHVIQSGLNLSNLYSMFTMTKVNVYEPLGWLLKAIEVQIVGLDSWSIRLLTVGLHFVAAAVLARASALLLDVIALLSSFTSGVAMESNEKRQRERGHWHGCCISAMMFAIHPVHVEVVGWPSAQPYTLCALFGNFALYAYIRAVYQKLREVLMDKAMDLKTVMMTTVASGHGRSDLLCCGLYTCALLSKSACIFLPVGFFLVDVLVILTLQPQLSRPTASQSWSYVIAKLPVVATLLAFCAVTVASNRNGMRSDTDLLSLTLWERVLKATTMPVWVIRRILWPTKLRPHYQLRPEDLSLANPDCLLSVSALLALSLYTFWLFRRRYAPQHMLALAYFVIMLLPVSGLVQHGMVSVGSDRYAYLCSIIAVPYGGFVLARWHFGTEVTASAGSKHVQSQRNTPDSCNQRVISMGGVAVLAGALLSISTNLVGCWRNEDALLEYSLRMDPADWRILDQRSTQFINSGHCIDHKEECQHLWELSYYFTPAGTLKSELQRLKLLIWLGEATQVCERYTELLEIHPDNCSLHNNVGVCLIGQGDVDGARRKFEQALESPGYEVLYTVPRENLRALNDWVNAKEAARARGEDDKSYRMYQVIADLMKKGHVEVISQELLRFDQQILSGQNARQWLKYHSNNASRRIRSDCSTAGAMRASCCNLHCGRDVSEHGAELLKIGWIPVIRPDELK